MDASSLPLDRDIDADDTVRVYALTAEILLHDLPDLPREPDLLSKSTLSFALLTELRSLTPTVQRSGSQGPFVTRRSLRSYTALAASSWRRAFAVAMRAWVSARAGTERAIVMARPRAAVWARVAQAIARTVAAAARKHAVGLASRTAAVAVVGAKHAVRVGARVHRLAVIHAVRSDAWRFRSSRAEGAARSQ